LRRRALRPGRLDAQGHGTFIARGDGAREHKDALGTAQNTTVERCNAINRLAIHRHIHNPCHSPSAAHWPVSALVNRNATASTHDACGEVALNTNRELSDEDFNQVRMWSRPCQADVVSPVNPDIRHGGVPRSITDGTFDESSSGSTRNIAPVPPAKGFVDCLTVCLIGEAQAVR
jgi:hypothetical protein